MIIAMNQMKTDPICKKSLTQLWLPKYSTLNSWFAFTSINRIYKYQTFASASVLSNNRTIRAQVCTLRKTGRKIHNFAPRLFLRCGVFHFSRHRGSKIPKFHGCNVSNSFFIAPVSEEVLLVHHFFFQ